MEKGCSNCKYANNPVSASPCSECIDRIHSTKTAFSLWEQKAESVDHPSHYNQGKYECIDVMVETFGKEITQNFCLLNAFKYLWRTGEKNGIEDIKKAAWYLNKYLELEGEDE